MEQRTGFAMGMHIAALAHDLRTPMCIAAGAAQMALDAGRQGKDVSAQLQAILQAVDTMNRMLAMADTEHTCERVCVFTGAMLQSELTAMTAEKACLRQQRLSIDLGELGGASLQADYAALSRVLLNLLSNAVKYTQIGGSITLRAHWEHGLWSSGRKRARFIIADNGAGMSHTFMRRMYEPFSRAQETASQPGKGLGLAIVHDMVKGMGGTIRVHSVRGRGTVFMVSVPVRIGGNGRMN